MRVKNTSQALIAIGAALIICLACGQKAELPCTGELLAEGRSFSGKGKDAAEAQRNSCNIYCLEADPDAESRYRIWLDSPKGKEARDQSKKGYMYGDKEFFAYITQTCADKCEAKIKEGSFKGEAKCTQ